MIADITPYNFPASYLSKATVNDAFMGDRNITASVKIISDVKPGFKNWYIVRDGEKYILPTKKPEYSIENKSLNASYELVFQHWAIYQLKRFLFAEMAEVGTETVIPDKYEATLGLNLGDFVKAFNTVLDYYYGGQIKMELNPDFAYPDDVTMVQISKSKIWEVLQQLYDLYAVTWRIEPATDNSHEDGNEKYVIKVGYPADEMDHVFRYGFEGGLMKFGQQVQSSDMANILLGRGGEKNLPYRYFKKPDENNVSFEPDPDWIPELENVYMDRLHGINFRYYVQGWKDAHHFNGPGTGRGDRRYAEGLHWAYDLGYTDVKFDPVEYVKDDVSIAEYGELWDCLDDNDDIYPTIQGIGDPETGWGIGRVDQVVDVEQIESDDVAQYADENAKQFDLPDASRPASVPYKSEGAVEFELSYDNAGDKDSSKRTASYDAIGFTVEDAEQDEENAAFLVFDFDIPTAYASKPGGRGRTVREDFTATVISVEKYAKDMESGELVNVSQLKGKHTYCPCVKVAVSNPGIGEGYQTFAFVTSISAIKWGYHSKKQKFANTFDIWIKDLWHSERQEGESDEDFVTRVWTPILGDKDNETAKVVFSSGWLSTSEDYEFEILGGTGKAAVTKGVHFDDGKTLEVKDRNGNVIGTYQSMWRLTLIKSDADLDSIGLYVPSTQRQGNAGDYFFLIGIDMPHQYVLWAEQRLTNYKTDQLYKISDIKPKKAVTFDKIRIQELQEGEVHTLISRIKVGGLLNLQDDRMLPAGEKQYIQSMTVEYSNSLYPTINVTLADEPTVSLGAVSTLQGEVSALQKQIGTLANIEAMVRVIGDKLYLRKDGQDDTSFSSTVFRNIIKSDGFTQGRLGGSGWALYRDGKRNTVLEVDKAIVRESMEVTELVVHQTEYVGGSRIESAASIKCDAVNPVNKVVDDIFGDVWNVVLDGSNPQAYQCFFDTKQGTVRNLFKVDDVAYSHVFDAGNASLKYYKRRVVEVGEDYIVLSNADEYVDGDGLPLEGDVIIHYGNYTDEARQYVKVSDVIGGGYDRFVEGLDSVHASGKEYYFAGKMANWNENPEGYRFFVGDRDRHYMEWKDGELTIKGKLTVDSTIGDKSVADYVEGLVDAATEDLQKQIDGAIETWFYEGVPTLTNQPANDWATNEDKDIHLGDLYYNKETGYAYRFMKDNGIYKWVELKDTDVTKALADASKAQATADGKMKVFSVQPTPPYSVGDMWVNAGTEKDIKVCVKDRATGSFVASDWGLASDYDCTEVVIENGIITGGTVQLAGGGKSASSANVKAGITGSGNTDDSVRIWSGATFGNRAAAKFRVLQSGAMYATEANIEGNIKTPEGGLSNEGGNNPIRFWCGLNYANRETAPFRVYKDGSVFMNNVTLAGNINFDKEVGYITAAVRKPLLVITSSNYSNYFDSSNKITIDFSFNLQITSVPSGVSLITIKYNGTNSMVNLSKNYGNTFSVLNLKSSSLKINYEGLTDSNSVDTSVQSAALTIFKSSVGYINYYYEKMQVYDYQKERLIDVPTIRLGAEENLGWNRVYPIKVEGTFGSSKYTTYIPI